MKIRHAIRGRLQPRGITPRRLAAARKALQRERQRLPLFANQVAAEQPSAPERIEACDLDLLRREQEHRDLAARHWRWGRNVLARQDEAVRREVVARWNSSTIPPEAAYFADFVRRQLMLRGLLPPGA
jgi:hypothetical protein